MGAELHQFGHRAQIVAEAKLIDVEIGAVRLAAILIDLADQGIDLIIADLLSEQLLIELGGEFLGEYGERLIVGRVDYFIESPDRHLAPLDPRRDALRTASSHHISTQRGKSHERRKPVGAM